MHVSLSRATLALLAALLTAPLQPPPAAAQPFTGELRQRVALLGGAALHEFTDGRPAAVFDMDPEAFHAAAATRMPAAGSFEGGALDGAALHLTTWVAGDRRRIETRMAGLPEQFRTVVLVTGPGEAVSLYPAMRRAARLPAAAARLFTEPPTATPDSAAGPAEKLGFERVRGWPADRWRWTGTDVRADLWIAPGPEARPGLQGAGAMSHPLAAAAAALPARMGQLPAPGAVVRILVLFQDPATGPTAVLLELDAVEAGAVDPARFTVPADYVWVDPPPGGTP
ncbi:MAG: DUF4412 domain-containing protein [Gemmatimonadota bacterium]